MFRPNTDRNGTLALLQFVALTLLFLLGMFLAVVLNAEELGFGYTCENSVILKKGSDSSLQKARKQIRRRLKRLKGKRGKSVKRKRTRLRKTRRQLKKCHQGAFGGSITTPVPQNPIPPTPFAPPPPDPEAKPVFQAAGLTYEFFNYSICNESQQLESCAAPGESYTGTGESSCGSQMLEVAFVIQNVGGSFPPSNLESQWSGIADDQRFLQVIITGYPGGEAEGSRLRHTTSLFLTKGDIDGYLSIPVMARLRAHPFQDTPVNPFLLVIEVRNIFSPSYAQNGTPLRDSLSLPVIDIYPSSGQLKQSAENPRTFEGLLRYSGSNVSGHRVGGLLSIPKVGGGIGSYLNLGGEDSTGALGSVLLEEQTAPASRGEPDVSKLVGCVTLWCPDGEVDRNRTLPDGDPTNDCRDFSAE